MNPKKLVHVREPKKQIGICYICNQPIYNRDRFQKVGIELKHTSQKCESLLQSRVIKDLPVRHPDYIKPTPIMEVPKVVPIVVIPPLNTLCKFCKVRMEKFIVIDATHGTEEGKIMKDKDCYQCPKCQQVSDEVELRKEMQ